MMLTKVLNLFKAHPQTLVSALSSIIAGLTATLPTVLNLSARTMSIIMFVASMFMLLLAQLKPILDKLYPPDAP